MGGCEALPVLKRGVAAEILRVGQDEHAPLTRVPEGADIIGHFALFLLPHGQDSWFWAHLVSGLAGSQIRVPRRVAGVVILAGPGRV